MKDTSNKVAVPKPTVNRLPHYRRALENLLQTGMTVVSSHELAREAEVTPSQLRKDLAFFGTFGTAGIGYNLRELIVKLDEILGTRRKRPVLLVGVGNLGKAILNHRFLSRSGFEVVASIDNSSKKIGRVISGVRCYPPFQLKEVVDRQGTSITLLTVPPHAAQEVAEQLVEAGVGAIINFTHVSLRLPDKILVENVDFGYILQKVAFYLDPTEAKK